MAWRGNPGTPVQIVCNAETAPVLKYTVPAGKTLYLTDILITVENSATSASGILEIFDALTATGTPVLPVFIPDPAPQTTTVTTFSHQFSTPLEFSTGVFWNEAAGTLTMSGLMLGFLA
jgi:hypothetical protein